MTAYNGSKYIKQQLDSIACQTILPDEVVVCDDLSSDDTADILEHYAQSAPFNLKVYRNIENIGYTRNFEKALSLCTGDLIFLSDQDDVWYENKISGILDLNRKHLGIDVIINDAIYVDQNLMPSAMTVLEKVLNFSGNKNDHIAGACTAITKRFKDFILPLPNTNCPAHDVYIHRWANLLSNKLVVPSVYQCWRIHGENNSISEMNHARKVSLFQLFYKYKGIDTSSSYVKLAAEFNEMMKLITMRKEALLTLSPEMNTNELQRTVNNIIVANMTRSRLIQANFLQRIKLIFFMLIRGQYRYFQGIRSAAKDIFR